MACVDIIAARVLYKNFTIAVWFINEIITKKKHNKKRMRIPKVKRKKSGMFS